MKYSKYRAKVVISVFYQRLSSLRVHPAYTYGVVPAVGIESV